MIRTILAILLFTSTLQAQSRPTFDAFEVATIKPTDPSKAGRYITMQTDNRFVVKNYTLKLLIAAAYDLNSRTISGGPAWIDSETYDITAVTPGDIRPTRAEQMTMLRKLLIDRFKLTFHREDKDFAVYTLEVAKAGPKLKPSAVDIPPTVGPATVYPEHVSLPARNATTSDFASLMQRAILDRPVVDRTGLTARYDFDLIWAPDETQFGGGVPTAPTMAPAPPLFTAIQQQLGLTLKPTRAAVSALVVDAVERPSAN